MNEEVTTNNKFTKRQKISSVQDSSRHKKGNLQAKPFWIDMKI